MVDQVDKEFTPKVTAVLVGTSVTFPNHDDVRHQVYSFSPAKRFELPLYAGVPAGPVVFDKPGVVVLGCNIHDWMVGYIYVSESPYFAKTGKDGKAMIAELPPRTYAVRVWHPRLEAAEETMQKSVDASRPARVDVAWQLKLKREVKVRRSPGAEGRGRVVQMEFAGKPYGGGRRAEFIRRGVLFRSVRIIPHLQNGDDLRGSPSQARAAIVSGATRRADRRDISTASLRSTVLRLHQGVATTRWQRRQPPIASTPPGARGPRGLPIIHLMHIAAG